MPLSLSPTHPYCSLCTVKPHLSGHPSDRRSSPSSVQPQTSLLRARIISRTRRRCARPADQSHDWLARSSLNRRTTAAPVFLNSATLPGVLSHSNLHLVKHEPAPMKTCPRHGKSFFIHRHHATARLPNTWVVFLELKIS